jgi:hypothetical protein
MYSFKCPECGGAREVVKTMSESDGIVVCKRCTIPMDRDFQADLPHAASDRYDKPIVSASMAMAIDQIPEHKRLFPDIEVTPQGEPVFDNYADHDAYLEKCNFVKHPGKRVNNSGKTVITMSDIRAKLKSNK